MTTDKTPIKRVRRRGPGPGRPSSDVRTRKEMALKRRRRDPEAAHPHPTHSHTAPGSKTKKGVNIVSRFFTSAPDEYKIVKMLLGFPFGSLIGIGLYYGVIVRMRMPTIVQYTLGAMFTLLLGMGYAVSTSVRCVAWLIVPTICGRNGRSYVGTFALAFLLAGPVANIMYNGKEVSRSIACSIKLAHNQTKAHLELRFKPIIGIVNELRKQGKNIRAVASKVKEKFNPVKNEIEDETEVEKAKKKVDEVDGVAEMEADHQEKITKVKEEFLKRLRERAKDIENRELKEKFEKIKRFAEDIKWESENGHKNNFLKDKAKRKEYRRKDEERREREREKRNREQREWEMNQSREKNKRITELVREVEKKRKEKMESSRSYAIEQRYKASGKDTDNEKSEKKYERKLDYRCEDVFSAGMKKCKATFKRMESSCRNKIKLPGARDALCWPFKITVACHLVKLIPGITGMRCDSTDSVNKGFGESFGTAQQAADQFEENFKVNLQYQVIEVEQELDKKTAEDVAKGVAYEFRWRQVWVEFFITLIKRLMAFLFLRLIWSAHKYHEGYVTNFQHDNIYMTAYFVRIDNRRREQGKSTLIPLKKLERKEIVNPSKMKMMGAEKSKLTKGSFRLVLRFLSFSMIFFVDHIIYEILGLIKRHCHVDFRQTGHHHIDLKVHGNGVIGQLFRNLLRGFSGEHSIDNFTSNLECLPNPSKTPIGFFFKVIAVLFATWLLMLIEAYSIRSRRAVAAFFYRKREKKRIIYLYNDLLKKRRGFLRHARHQVRRKVKEQRLNMRVGVLQGLRRHFPRLCSCLKTLGAGKASCLICDEQEGKTFHHCATPGCNFGYCTECWGDIKEKCYACRHDDDWDSESTLTDMGFSDNDE